MALQFEIATPANCSQILDMQEKFYALDNYPFQIERAGLVLQHFLESPDLGKIYLIYSQDELLGYLALTFCYSFEFGGKIALIDEFFITEKYRHLGFGSETLTYVIEVAKDLGLKILHLEAERHNHAGKALYHKFGFRDHDRHLMTKYL